ncbi:MAG: DNA methyltransferase [Candidatus Paceibacterota bacterium]|jgi:DNA modification methylase
MQKLQWFTEVRDVENLLVWKDNPRKITKLGLEKLKERIIQRGFHDVIVIDTDNTILSGNQRKVVLQQLGVKKVNVLVPSRSLTKDERTKIALESNLNDGEWDFQSLKSFKFDVLIDSGFDEINLTKIWDKEKEVIDDNFEIEKELKKIKKPITKLGDIIVLGKHRLLCGDSTKQENLKRLLGQEKASMIFSDSVYNLDVNYDSGLGGNQSYGGQVNDHRTFEEYKKFLKDSLECALAVSHSDTHVFYFCDQIYIGVVQDIYRSLGINNKRVAIWLKNSQNPVPSVAFNKNYEPAVYGIRGKPYLAETVTNLNEVMNKEMGTGNNLLEQISDIWAVKRLPAKEYTHATSKPPQLYEKAIKRCTKVDDIILDSFLGSGSTIIAGEALSRRVYGCELEPQFCDLIIHRYEKLTGRKAIIEHYEER